MSATTKARTNAANRLNTLRISTPASKVRRLSYLSKVRWLSNPVQGARGHPRAHEEHAEGIRRGTDIRTRPPRHRRRRPEHRPARTRRSAPPPGDPGTGPRPGDRAPV